MSIEWDRRQIDQMLADAANARAREALPLAERHARGRFGLAMEPATPERIDAAIYATDPAALVAEYGDGVSSPDPWGWPALLDAAQGVGEPGGEGHDG